MVSTSESHANDAVAIAAHGMESIINSTETTFYKQLRKQKRSLHEATPRKGRREPNLTAKRNRKNTCVVKGWYLNDKVTVFGKIGWISGFSGFSGKSSVYITLPPALTPSRLPTPASWRCCRFALRWRYAFSGADDASRVILLARS